MAGHLGDVRKTVQSVEIIETRVEDGLILVKGGIPGAKESWVLISDAAKKAAPEGLPMPAAFRAPAQADAPAEAPAEAAAPAEANEE
jgi:large subunit ribosomal protein L3